MAKTVGLIFTLCFLALANVHAHEVFNVEGDVYCDPCRVQFVTDLSKKMAGNFFKPSTFKIHFTFILATFIIVGKKISLQSFHTLLL